MSQGWEVLNRHGSPMPWKAPRTATASGGGGNGGGLPDVTLSCTQVPIPSLGWPANQSVACPDQPDPYSSSLENHATPSLDCRTSLSCVCLPAVEVGVMQLSVLPGVRPIPVLP